MNTDSFSSELSRLVNRLPLLLPATLLLVSSIFLFGPATIYSGNPAEFTTGFWSIEAHYGYPAALLFAVLSSIGLVLPRTGLPVYASLLFGVAVLVWMQGSILVWDYGVFDGSGIKWEEFWWRGVVDAAVWASLLVSAVIFRERVTKLSGPISLALIAMQGIVMVSSYSSLKPEQASGGTEIPPALLEYSSSFNIVHILLDSFQTETFEEIVSEKQLGAAFEGFVLFRDNMSVYGLTNFSLPSIFSGEPFRGQAERARYLSDAYSEKAFYTHLFDAGYAVNLVTSISTPAKRFSSHYRVPSVYGATRREEEINEAMSLMDVVLFRNSPQFLKKEIYNSENWLVRRVFASKTASGAERKLGFYHQLEFFRDYTSRIEVGGPQPRYHFVHLLPPHPPRVAYSDCEYAGRVLDDNNESLKGEATCVVSLVTRFLAKLRDVGLYDSSFIILDADHGTKGGSQPSKIRNKPAGDVSPSVVVSSLALLAVKSAQAKGPMSVSNAQSMLTDIPSTVMEAAGLPNPYSGVSVFDLDPNGRRERWFFVSKELPGETLLSRYKVTGTVYDYQSWSREKDISRPHVATLYKWGSPIQFGIRPAGNALQYQKDGWGQPWDDRNWTNGRQAALSIPIAELGSSAVLMKVKFDALVYPGIVDTQTVNVLINGETVASWVVSKIGAHDFSVTISRSIVSSSDHLEIIFGLPDAVRAGLVPGHHGEEIRGISLRRIVLAPQV